MSAIDTQNAKQIRDPMDVLITMELADDTTTLTFSGYSTAKVADGKLANPTWPMRKLADLQGDGFPLDGSCVLYDSTTTPSQTNGKIGVRGNVGETVSVTVTGNKSIASLTIFATGAESVTYGGVTTNFINNQVVIPVGAASVTITFNPANATQRVEISEITPGTKFRITNDNLIRATVSLRSDLSIEQTLPESEINIEVYQDTDISEAVAMIPEDTPIIYQAGYPGDMSPERRFYVSGQVTWADNVLTIHGVDAVHFLDWSMTTPLGMKSFKAQYVLLRMLGDISGIAMQYEDYSNVIRGGDTGQHIVMGDFNVRDLFAAMNNLFHQDVSAADSIWTTYVDAGIPSLSISKPSTKWSIMEEDCCDIVKDNIVPTQGINVKHNTATYSASIEAGSAEWIKNVGVTLNYNSDNIGRYIAIGLYAGPGGGETNEQKYLNYFHDASQAQGVIPIIPADKKGDTVGYVQRLIKYSTTIEKFTNSGISQRDMEQYPKLWDDDDVYASFVPWSAQYDNGSWSHFSSQAEAWSKLVLAGILAADDTSVSLRIGAGGYSISNADLSVGTNTERNPEMQSMMANDISIRFNSDNLVKVYPEPAFDSLLNRSISVGSFTWKGDPRHQPRDVVEWERLDGTTTTITMENITLTHEGGGTYAEITYREGVV